MKIQNLPSLSYKLSEYRMIITELINEKPQKETVALSMGAISVTQVCPRLLFNLYPTILVEMTKPKSFSRPKLKITSSVKMSLTQISER